MIFSESRYPLFRIMPEQGFGGGETGSTRA